MSTPTPKDETADVLRDSVYVASRASLPERGQMWRDFRAQGVPINSTWIDEDGPKASRDLGDLWDRIRREVTSAAMLVLYVEPGDFPMKGALIEVGMALAARVPVVVVAPGVVLEPRNCRPLGSWIKSPLVSFARTVEEAFARHRIAALSDRAAEREGAWTEGELAGRQSMAHSAMASDKAAGAWKARAEKAEELADKYKWQVRDTCTRAETADALVTTLRTERDALSRRLEAVEGALRADWQPMETAPRNDTLVELVVNYSDGDHPLADGTLACTVGFNTDDNTGADEGWKFAGWCWTHDHFVQGKGVPVAWRPSRLNATDDGLSALPARAALATTGGAK